MILLIVAVSKWKIYSSNLRANKALVRTQTTLRFVCAAQLGRKPSKGEFLMLIKMFAVAVVSGAAGFFLGRQSSVMQTEPMAMSQRAVAYMDLFSALGETYSSVLNASVEDQLSEGTKQAMWNSLNVLSRTSDKWRFLFPEDLVTVMAEWIDAPFLQQGWDERLETLKRMKEKAYFIARKEFAGN